MTSTVTTAGEPRVPGVEPGPGGAGPVKSPPTIERGSPVSACQRSGSVKVDIGTGTTRTLAEGGSRSAANAAVQPAGTGVAAATGSGFGTMGRTARTAAAITTAAGRQPADSRGTPRVA